HPVARLQAGRRPPARGARRTAPGANKMYPVPGAPSRPARIGSQWSPGTSGPTFAAPVVPQRAGPRRAAPGAVPVPRSTFHDQGSERMSRVLMCVLLLFLSGCASVPREEALKLGAAGQKAAEAGQAALADLAGEVGGFPERSAVLLTVATCTAPAAPSPCGISQAPGDVLTADEKLAGVISLRARALSQLHSAYGAFLEEAEYDAAVDIDQSLGELADSVNNLAGAMALLSGGTS